VSGGLAFIDGENKKKKGDQILKDIQGGETAFRGEKEKTNLVMGERSEIAVKDSFGKGFFWGGKRQLHQNYPSERWENMKENFQD